MLWKAASLRYSHDTVERFAVSVTYIRRCLTSSINANRSFFYIRHRRSRRVPAITKLADGVSRLMCFRNTYIRRYHRSIHWPLQRRSTHIIEPLEAKEFFRASLQPVTRKVPAVGWVVRAFLPKTIANCKSWLSC